MTKDEKRTQVAEQCKVVAHLARALAEVHEDHQRLFERGGKAADDLVNIVGKRSAHIMETLGDILNGMDACTEDDDWTSPIFDEAQRLWPSESVEF